MCVLLFKEKENNMADDNDFQMVLNKLVALEDKFSEIKSITKVLNIWIKENDYELIPIINMLNGKIDDMTRIIGK